MNTHADVADLLEQWRQQTLRESEALRANDWNQVRACQETKAQVRTLLEQAEGPSPKDLPERLRQLVVELVALESANSRWLARQTASLQARQTELADTSRRLHRVRRSYGAADRLHWESYS
jgi:succinate dehydrogenase/fumarate reductase flavoprotein subunit